MPKRVFGIGTPSTISAPASARLFGRLPDSRLDLRLDRLLAQLAGGRVGNSQAEVVGREADAQTAHPGLEAFAVVGDGDRGGGGVDRIRAGHDLQGQGGVLDVARHQGRAIQRRGEGDQAVARTPGRRSA